jgi:protein-S-isoprenylcysteine O-methyltransferase Ste14
MRTLIVVCWLVFLTYWLATWSWSKPEAVGASPGRRTAYRVVLGAGVVFFVSAFAGTPVLSRLMPETLGVDVVAGVLCTCGLFLAVAARYALGENWSSKVTLKHGHELITSGPYRLVRHPIYAGMVLMFLGSAVGLGRVDGLIGSILCFAGFWIKLQQEEALMMRQFPTQYPAYRARVKAVVPFLL